MCNECLNYDICKTLNVSMNNKCFIGAEYDKNRSVGETPQNVVVDSRHNS